VTVYSPVPDAASIQAVQDVLKEVFVSDTLESQMYEDTILLNWIEDVTEYTDSNGLFASVPMRVGRTGGISARAIGEKLGVADHQKVGKAKYEYTNQYLQIKVEGPVVARMRTNRQACIREIDKEVQWGIEDLKRDWQRQLYGNGTAVVAAKLPALGVANQWVPLGAANEYVIDRGYLYEGQKVDIGTAGNPVLDTGGNKIIDIDDTAGAPRIKLENATTVTANSDVSLYGNRNADGDQRELNGLGNIISDTAVLGEVDPAVKRWWKGHVLANGGVNRALSVNLLLNTIKALRKKGKYPDRAVADLDQEQAYYNLLQGQVRFAGDSELAAGNTIGLQLGKIKSGFVGDPDCPPNRVFIFHGEALQMYSAGPVAWQNQTTGGDILAWSQDYDAFVARAAKYFQLGTDRRTSTAALMDLS
jgi:hypothetical protein